MLAEVTHIGLTAADNRINNDALMLLVGWLVALIVVGGGVGFLIGRSRGKPVLGFFLGLFGLFGWILMAVLPRTPEAEARHNLEVAQKMSSIAAPTS